MSPRAALGGAAVGLAIGALLAAGSQWPWQAEPEGAAAIRLAWRIVSEPLSECRAPTPEELAALPPHMRMKEICERRHVPYRLVVRVDERTVREKLVTPAGARGDRPLYVFEELRVSPGTRRLAVSFREERDAAAAGSRPPAPPLELDASLELAPRDVALVGLDTEGAGLAVRMPDER